VRRRNQTEIEHPVTQAELLRVRFVEMEVSQLLRERAALLTALSGRLRSGADVEAGQLYPIFIDKDQVVVTGPRHLAICRNDSR
jgi:hypothetical protein